jgi:hypothetical protein
MGIFLSLVFVWFILGLISSSLFGHKLHGEYDNPKARQENHTIAIALGPVLPIGIVIFYILFLVGRWPKIVNEKLQERGIIKCRKSQQ